jgi:tetratricopeptide (TPR) repeat protein
MLAADPLNVAALKQLASAARALDWLETAVLAHEAVREAAPGDTANLIALGQAWLRLDKPREALRLADEVLRARPVDAAAQDLMREASIAQTMAQGRWENGQGFRAKLKDEAAAVSLEAAARTVNAAEATERLVREAEARVRAEPANLNHYRAIVDGWRQLGRTEEALTWLQRARALPAGAADAALAKEETALRLADWAERVRAAEAACATAPDDTGAAAALAAAREEEAAFRLSAAQALVERYPNDWAARLDLGQMLFERGRIDGAIAQFQAATKSPATRAAALTGLGRCFAAKKLFDLAVAQLSTVKAELGAMTEQKKEVLYELGVALAAMGRKDEAMAEFKAIYSEDIGFRDVLERINAHYAS